MDLSIYTVIKGPWVTTKAYRLNVDNKKLVLEVHPRANKPMIVEALRKIFNAEAAAVRTVIIKGKKKKNRRGVFYGKERKKAIVTLKGDIQSSGLSALSVPVVVQGSSSNATESK